MLGLRRLDSWPTLLSPRWAAHRYKLYQINIAHVVCFYHSADALDPPSVYQGFKKFSDAIRISMLKNYAQIPIPPPFPVLNLHAHLTA